MALYRLKRLEEESRSCVLSVSMERSGDAGGAGSTEAYFLSVFVTSSCAKRSRASSHVSRMTLLSDDAKRCKMGREEGFPMAPRASAAFQL